MDDVRVGEVGWLRCLVCVWCAVGAVHAEHVRPVLVERGEDPLPRAVAVREDGDIVAVDEVARRERRRTGLLSPSGFVREEDLLDDVAVAVVAEERRVVAVVRDDSHAPVRGLLADAEEPDGREPIDIEPARLHVVVAVVLVARRLVGARVVRDCAGEDAREIGLADDAHLLAELQASASSEASG